VSGVLGKSRGLGKGFGNMRMRLVYAVACCVLLALLVLAGHKIDQLEEQVSFWRVAHTSVATYMLAQEKSWDAEREQWQRAVEGRDEIIQWWENKPPGVVEKVVEVPVEVEVIREVEVVKSVDYSPTSFQSTEAVRAWVENWEPHARAFGGTVKFNSACEDYAYAMLVDMVNDGYLVGTQIDPYRAHMMVVVPVYPENRYVFVEPFEQTLSLRFVGREWRIN